MREKKIEYQWIALHENINKILKEIIHQTGLEFIQI